MKRALLIVIALALAPAAVAQLYKHVDKDGKVTYSDQPPASGDSKRINIPTGVTNAPSGARSYVAEDKDLDKKRKEAREKQAKGGDAAKKEEESARRCEQARAAHQYFAEGGRIFKPGTRDYMSDAEIDAERERTRREMDEACKGR